jgi:endonuclease/exonuclease/phosphatase family metal-dependent hydrolase
MRVLQYNIWNGCQSDPARLARLGKWLKRQAYDVVGLNELNGWDQSPDIHELGRRWGYPYTDILEVKHSSYLVGLLSRHPLERKAAVGVPFHHGALHVIVLGVHYIVVHLTPASAVERRKEAAYLAEMIVAISEPLLVMGDLNTLSPLDAEAHDRVALVDILRQDPGLRRKFLTPYGDIDYQPMQILLDAGLRDLGTAVPVDYSVPTATNQDKGHAARMRLDYVLANSSFDAQAPKALVLHDDATDALSDHYPVECTWNERVDRGVGSGTEACCDWA